MVVSRLSSRGWLGVAAALLLATAADALEIVGLSVNASEVFAPVFATDRPTISSASAAVASRSAAATPSQPRDESRLTTMGESCLDQAFANRKPHELSGPMETELLHQPLAVRIHRAPRQAEVGCDLVVGLASADPAKDRLFSSRERGDAWCLPHRNGPQ
jgi:hypothetical protein